MSDAIIGYEEDAVKLIPRYNAISCDELFSVVLNVFPTSPASIIDIGAGTGRDAAWLAQKGHNVLAVEPVEAFRRVGAETFPFANVRWIDDRLPSLEASIAQGETFDFGLMSGVWQHLSPEERTPALNAISQLIKPDGTFLMSVRHGPGVNNRPVFKSERQATIDLILSQGFEITQINFRPSVQSENIARGVMWTWITMKRQDN